MGMARRTIPFPFVLVSCQHRTGLLWNPLWACEHTDVWDMCLELCHPGQHHMGWDKIGRFGVWQYLDKEPTRFLHVFVLSVLPDRNSGPARAVCCSPKNPGHLTEPAWRMAGSSCPCAWIKSFSQAEQPALELGVLGLPSNGYVGERLKWELGKVGTCGWKRSCAGHWASFGREDKPSRISQQQVEKEKNRTKWNLYPWNFGKVALGEKSEMNHEPNIQKL